MGGGRAGPLRRQPGAGVLSLHGKMVDRPHLKLAERILAAAASANW